jgi:hypothetical protein
LEFDDSDSVVKGFNPASEGRLLLFFEN